MTWLTPEHAWFALGFIAGSASVAAALVIADVVHLWRDGGKG